MSEPAKRDRDPRPRSLQDDHTSASLVDLSVGNPLPRSTPVAISQQSEPGIDDEGKQSKQAYIASLRRSIQQMTNGDVQPVREGLEELRRELDAGVEDNSLDK